jgi:hypothetical protein
LHEILQKWIGERVLEIYQRIAGLSEFVAESVSFSAAAVGPGIAAV